MIDQAGYFRPHRAERIIAAGRLFLALFFLLALVIDPAESAPYAAQMRRLALTYLVYASAIALITSTRRTVPSALPLATHIIDLVLFSVFMYFSQGSASPFFVSFVFATICGALRWHGRGALRTGIAALSLYIGLTIGAVAILRSPGAYEPARFMTRCTQLAVITVLLAYVGDHQRRLQAEIASLAAWPRRLPPQQSDAVRDVLARAASILHAPRILLTWQDAEEPSLRVATFGRDRFELSHERPDVFGSLVAETLQRSSFLCDDASAESPFVIQRVPGGFSTWRGKPLDAGLRDRFGIRSVLALRIATESVEGRLFALDHRSLSVDDLLLGDVVGRLVASALEQQALSLQLRDSAAGEERLRLARELHDGVLQSLTAVALQTARVRDIMTRDPAEAAQRLTLLESTILNEQRAIRSMVNELKPRRTEEGLETNGAARLRDVAEGVARQWDVQVHVDTSASVPPLPGRVLHEICRITQEALVNAIRHGQADEITVEWRAADDSVQLAIAYRGRGFSTFQGRHDLRSLNSMQAGPRTLKERVSEIGGELIIESNDEGARVEVSVPIRSRAADSGIGM